MKHFYFIFCLWLSVSMSVQSGVAQQVSTQLSTQPIPTAYPLANAHAYTFGDSPFSPGVQNRESSYEFSLEKDLPILLGSAGMLVAGNVLMGNVERLSEADLAVLDPNRVNAFDRAATRQYRYKDAGLSDILLTTSAIVPFTLLASQSVRQEFAPMLVMYFETVAVTGGLTNISKGLFQRRRPLAYNPEADLGERQSDNARHSFFSGHVSVSAAFHFLTASMVSRYADRQVWKYVAWTGAVVVPGTIGYWRYTSGKHFPTDIITGYLIGAATGLIIPYIHRSQLPEDLSLQIQVLPHGLSMSLTF